MKNFTKKQCVNPDCMNHVKRSNQKFCSVRCKNAVNNAKRAVTKTKKCTVCKKTFTTTDNKQKFCAQTCKHERAEQIAQESYDLLRSTRRDFIELRSEPERQKFADDMIERYCTDSVMRRAFYRHLKLQFKPDFIYNPHDISGKKVNPKRPFAVVLHDKYNDDFTEWEPVVSIFAYKVPTLSFPIYYGQYQYKSHAERKKANLEKILSYNDDRTQLLLDARVVQHNRVEATLHLEEINRWVDAFIYTEGRCRYLHDGLSIDEFYKKKKGAKNEPETIHKPNRNS